MSKCKERLSGAIKYNTFHNVNVIRSYHIGQLPTLSFRENLSRPIRNYYRVHFLVQVTDTFMSQNIGIYIYVLEQRR